MNRLSREKQIEIVKALVEGSSIRSVSRMTDVARNTISKLILDLGEACAAYHDKHVRGLESQRVQCDEIWSFVGKKDRQCTPEERSTIGVGSVWTWTAIDADTKLVISYHVGGRDGQYAYEFMQDVSSRIDTRIQLTTDAHGAYFRAVEEAFWTGIDYAMLVKKYGNPPQGPETRYSPAVCIGAEKKSIKGNPDPKHISTSYVERQNLTMRMSMRWFTRLTNGFSKNVEFHIASIAIHFMYYNFVRIHQTLRMTPAMKAGLTDHLWNVGDLVDLIR